MLCKCSECLHALRMASVCLAAISCKAAPGRKGVSRYGSAVATMHLIAQYEQHLFSRHVSASVTARCKPQTVHGYTTALFVPFIALKFADRVSLTRRPPTSHLLDQPSVLTWDCTQLEASRRNAEAPSEMEVLRRQERDALALAAKKKLLEQEDEVKHMNRMVAYSRCAAERYGRCLANGLCVDQLNTTKHRTQTLKSLPHRNMIRLQWGICWL